MTMFSLLYHIDDKYFAEVANGVIWDEAQYVFGNPECGFTKDSYDIPRVAVSGIGRGCYLDVLQHRQSGETRTYIGTGSRDPSVGKTLGGIIARVAKYFATWNPNGATGVVRLPLLLGEQMILGPSVASVI